MDQSAPIPEGPPKSNRSLFIILASVLLLVLIGAGAYLYTKTSHKPAQPTPTPTQSTQPTSSTPSTSLPTTPKLNLDLKITIESTDSGKIKGKLTLVNKSSAGADNLYWTVSLKGPANLTKTGQSLDGKPVYNLNSLPLAYNQSKNSLTIKGGESQTLPFELSYSSHIPLGSSTLQAEIVNEMGDNLTISPPQSVNLKGSSDLVTVNHCQVIIKPDPTSPTDVGFYNTQIAPIVPKGSTVVGECQFTNPSNQALSLSSNITYAVLYLQDYPKSKAQGQTEQNITFTPKETKTIDFTLPTNLDPQVYEADLSFLDSDNQQLLPIVHFRWTLPGDSGRIENLTLNNDHYLNGDTAQVNLTADPSMDLWWQFANPPAPNSSKSKVNTLTGTLLNKPSILVVVKSGNQVCGQTSYQIPAPFTEPKLLNVNVPIKQDCLNPTVDVKLINNGQELASGSLALISPQITRLKNQGSLISYLIPIIILGIALIVIIVIIFLKKRKNSTKIPPSLIIILSLGMALLLHHLGQPAQAQTTNGNIVSPPNLVSAREYSTWDDQYNCDTDPDSHQTNCSDRTDVYDVTVTTDFHGSEDINGNASVWGQWNAYQTGGGWCGNHTGDSLAVLTPIGWVVPSNFSSPSETLNGGPRNYTAPWSIDSNSLASLKGLGPYTFYIDTYATNQHQFNNNQGVSYLPGSYPPSTPYNGCWSSDPYTSNNPPDAYNMFCDGNGHGALSVAPLACATPDGSSTCSNTTYQDIWGNTCPGTKLCPGSPQSSQASLCTTNGTADVSLSWSAVPLATSYQLYRNGSLLSSPAATSYTDSAVSPGTYNYTLSACNSGGCSAQSPPTTVTVSTCDSNPPSVSFYKAPSQSCYTNSSWDTDQPFSAFVSDPAPSSGLKQLTFQVTQGGGIVQCGGVSCSQTINNPANNPGTPVSTPAHFGALANGDNYILQVYARDNAGNQSSVISSNPFSVKSSCVSPFIQGQNGDVHSNTSISAPGGP